MTGRTFSASAVGQARSLAARAGADARFVQADGYPAAKVPGRKSRPALNVLAIYEKQARSCTASRPQPRTVTPRDAANAPEPPLSQARIGVSSL
jgi:hypothetical protein